MAGGPTWKAAGIWNMVEMNEPAQVGHAESRAKG